MNDAPAGTSRKLRTALICAAGIFAMIGLSYASVPLYRLFCQVTGYGGTTQIAAYSHAMPVLERSMVVRFDANTSQGLPWDFEPVEARTEVQIGAVSQAYYRAVNRSDEPVTGVATFNVVPYAAGLHFNKQECFCFVEQTLQPGEEALMGVTFFVDPDIVDYKEMDDVSQITLSYTFFPKEAFMRPREKKAEKGEGEHDHHQNQGQGEDEILEVPKL